MDGGRIIGTIVLPAPRNRVWAAIAEAARFGAWFGAAFEGAFLARPDAV